MLYEAQLNCVHPLCHRWTKSKKQVRRLVYVDDGDDPMEACRRDLADSRRRKCNECRRVISLDHLTIKRINPFTGDYMDESQ